METVVRGISNVIVYIDNLLVHSSDHEEHLKLLDQTLIRLEQNGIRINLHFRESMNVLPGIPAYRRWHQARKGQAQGSSTSTSSCTEPNQRVHADLLGPLKVSGSPKKYIFCVTDTLTKYAELVALPDKEAPTVATGIFETWICQHGCPLELVTDQGKLVCWSVD